MTKTSRRPLCVLQVANPKSPHVQAWAPHHEAAHCRVIPVASHADGLTGGVEVLWSVVSGMCRGLLAAAKGERVIVEAHGAGRAGMLASFFPFRTVVIVHGSEVLRRGNLVKRLVVSGVLRLASDVIVTSRATVDQMREDLRRTRVDPHVIHPGVPWSKLRSLTQDGAPGSVISLRRMLPMYHVDALVRGFERQSAGAVSRLTLMIGDAPATSAYASEVLSLSLSVSHVEVVEEFLGKEGFVRLVARHEVAVSLADSDQMSEAVLEALAVGCALVVSDLSAYGPLRELPHVFLVADPSDDGEIAHALSRASLYVRRWPKQSDGARRADAARDVFERWWSTSYVDLLKTGQT